MSNKYPCGECGWVGDGKTYHPYVACLIVKATGKNPLPYLWDIGAHYAEQPDDLPASYRPKLVRP